MKSQYRLHFLIIGLISITYIALVTLIPSVKYPSMMWKLDKQRLVELFLLGFVLLEAITLRLSNLGTFAITKKIRLSLLILLALTGFSISLALAPRHAMAETSVLIGLGYLALLIARLYQQDPVRFLKRMIIVLWASVLLYLLAFYTGYTSALLTQKPLSWPQPFTGFNNIRSFNQYQFWLIGFLTLPILWIELKRSTLIFLHIALIAWWVLLYYTASRGVLIAWAGAMMLTLFMYKKMAWPFIKMQITHMSLGFLSFYLLFKLTPQTTETSVQTIEIIRSTTNDRLALWDQAILIFKTFPIFGAGPMHYAWYNKTNAHPHNSILQLASEWGLPAMILILGIGSYGLFKWIERFNVSKLQNETKLNQHAAIILFFTIAANFAYSLVDGVIVSPISQVLMFSMIGMMLGQYFSKIKIAHNHSPKLRPLIAAITLMMMIWSTLPEIRQWSSGSPKEFSMDHTADAPRFWRRYR